MKDICLNCGKEYKKETWGAECDCDDPNVVHQFKCHGCNNIMGVMIGDDYVGMKKLYCPDCVDKKR